MQKLQPGFYESHFSSYSHSNHTPPFQHKLYSTAYVYLVR